MGQGGRGGQHGESMLQSEVVLLCDQICSTSECFVHALRLNNFVHVSENNSVFKFCEVFFRRHSFFSCIEYYSSCVENCYTSFHLFSNFTSLYSIL